MITSLFFIDGIDGLYCFFPTKIKKTVLDRDVDSLPLQMRCEIGNSLFQPFDPSSFLIEARLSSF